jgi:hypothetical protein
VPRAEARWRWRWLLAVEMAAGGGIPASRARIRRPLGRIWPAGAQTRGVVVGGGLRQRRRQRGGAVAGQWCGYAKAVWEPHGLLRWPSYSSGRGRPWQTRQQANNMLVESLLGRSARSWRRLDWLWSMWTSTAVGGRACLRPVFRSCDSELKVAPCGWLPVQGIDMDGCKLVGWSSAAVLEEAVVDSCGHGGPFLGAWRVRCRWQCVYHQSRCFDGRLRFVPILAGGWTCCRFLVWTICDELATIELAAVHGSAR